MNQNSFGVFFNFLSSPFLISTIPTEIQIQKKYKEKHFFRRTYFILKCVVISFYSSQAEKPNVSDVLEESWVVNKQNSLPSQTQYRTLLGILTKLKMKVELLNIIHSLGRVKNNEFRSPKIWG